VRLGERATRRRLVLLATLLMPGPLKVAILRRQRGWHIGKGVSIGLSWLDAEQVTLADGVRIGHFNLVRNLLSLSIGQDSFVKDFNSFFGAGAAAREWFPSNVEIGARVVFMSRHFVDGSGTLVIGDDVTVGGRSTEIYTHQRERRDGVPVLCATQVVVGDRAYVGARCTLVSCRIPARAVVGAGAVVVNDHEADGKDGAVLLAGNPARVAKHYTD
jgi:acetyltransferase-like isoleucine patch superfamily enzyme